MNFYQLDPKFSTKIKDNYTFVEKLHKGGHFVSNIYSVKANEDEKVVVKSIILSSLEDDQQNFYRS